MPTPSQARSSPTKLGGGERQAKRPRAHPKIPPHEAKATAKLCAQTPGLTWRQARWVVRKAVSKSVLELIHEACEKEAPRIMQAYWGAIDGGDWKASEALLNRVYGKAAEHLTLDRGEALRQQIASLTPAERAELHERIQRRKALEEAGEPAVIEGEVVSQAPDEDVSQH